MYLLLSSLLLLNLGAAPPLGRSDQTAEEALLLAARIGTQADDVQRFLRKRYLETTEDRMRQLVEQLGDDDWFRREEATHQLRQLGLRAKRALEVGLRSDDLEIRARARLCMTEAEHHGREAQEWAIAAVRHLARLAPSSATDLLLKCLDVAEDEAVASEMRLALTQVALTKGKPNDQLLETLKSSSPRLRAAAVFALCRAADEKYLDGLDRAFDDPDASVRLSAAVGLLERGRKKAITALIAEMDKDPSRETAIAEDLLFRLAGEKSPKLAGPSEAERKAYRTAWLAWWKENEDKVNLDVLIEHARIAGFTTVVLLDRDEILDLDASNRVRFTLTGLGMPLDVQRLPRDRVLIAEHGANRVTERNAKNQVVWEHRVVGPLVAQRLPNGNTFIATKQELIEVDPKGNTVWTYSRPAGEQIMRARRLPGGDTILVTQLGVSRFVCIDRFGREKHSFGVEVYTSGGRIDLTPAGNVLIPELHNHRVVERDMSGTIVREIKVEQPITALALPGGNILVTSMTQNRAYEIDRTGKEVWEYKRETRVTRAVRP
ncbi:MAG: HEAT repeat domain-containing protein [Gemmataceae bacterium]